MANRKKQVLKAADGVLAPDEHILAAVLSQPAQVDENGSPDAVPPEAISRVGPETVGDAAGFAAKVPNESPLWWAFSNQRLLGFAGRQFLPKPSKLSFEFPSDVLLGLKLAGDDGAELMEVHFVDGSITIVGVPNANSGVQEFASDADHNDLLLPD